MKIYFQIISFCIEILSYLFYNRQLQKFTNLIEELRIQCNVTMAYTEYFFPSLHSKTKTFLCSKMPHRKHSSGLIIHENRKEEQLWFSKTRKNAALSATPEVAFWFNLNYFGGQDVTSINELLCTILQGRYLQSFQRTFITMRKQTNTFYTSFYLIVAKNFISKYITWIYLPTHNG